MTRTVVYFEEITVNLDRPKSLFYLIRSNKLFSVYLKSVSCLEQSCLRSILSLDSSQVRHHLPSLHWRCEISYDLFSNSVLKPKSFFSLWLKRLSCFQGRSSDSVGQVRQCLPPVHSQQLRPVSKGSQLHYCLHLPNTSQK